MRVMPVPGSDAESVIPRRPHHVIPEVQSARVVLAIKNFAAIPGVCHIGLGVTALNTMRVLRRYGVQVEAWSAQTSKELWQLLAADEGKNPPRPVTHVIISAPSWVQPVAFHNMSLRWPEIEFVQLNHSGMAYLSIDKFGIRNIRDVAELQNSHHNIRVAGNNQRFTRWLHGAFGAPELYLPNLYDVSTFVSPVIERRDYDPLRIGSFGASRPWKNQLTAAEAAVEMSRRMMANLEFYVNTKRPDGGERMIESRAELFNGLPHAAIKQVPWALWPKFRQVVRTMDVMFSPSFDETFCVVVADGIAEGVPSVVTEAMEWCPKSWMAEPHDPQSIMTVGMGLLKDRQGAIQDGRRALTNFVNTGVHYWLNYLSSPERG